MRTLYSLALIVVFLFTQCSSDDDPDKAGFPKAEEGTMTALVGEDEWVSDPNETAISIIDNTISIGAKAPDGSSMSLVVVGTETGTYEIQTINSGQIPLNSAAFSPANLAVSNPTFASLSISNSAKGSITISNIDTDNATMSGSFDVTLSRFVDGQEELIDVTGEFNTVGYTDSVVPIDDNSFSVKVNGVAFEPELISGAIVAGKLTLVFNNGAVQGISIDLPTNVSTGTQNLGGFGTAISALYYLGSVRYSSFNGSGAVIVTQHDTTNKRIEGTFSFDAEEWPLGSGTVSITEGEFALTYK
ncbi:hypothetical protein FNH22_05035 [Fulvivirga sp. M361]|uniref:DUF6252 family protein n=1 Tax=Fulvivirga sp. M361 TaxID=2594266 RepID=UPI00117B4CEA|nr:DUF6252 family protein [Fulvivirga sp. M361]TRX61423.1 hypothetical protein FNH22_05035 [Fulvivirga sp. M361]